jgi:hypothetical protein
MTALFDIVVPVGPNDIEHIQKQIDHCRKNIVGYRQIFIVSPFKELKVDGCTVIDESIYPFLMKDVIEIRGPHERNGWYLQQLLKLYAPFVIPGLMDTFLVVDSDTFFLRPTTFLVNGKCAYNPSREYNSPYFVHMAKMHPTLTRQYQQMSGVSHHMISSSMIRPCIRGRSCSLPKRKELLNWCQRDGDQRLSSSIMISTVGRFSDLTWVQSSVCTII